MMLIEDSKRIKLNNEFQECIMPIIEFCNKYNIENPNDLIKELKVFYNRYDHKEGICAWHADCKMLNAL